MTKNQVKRTIPECKMAVGDIAKDMNRFFKKLTWITHAIAHTIEKNYEDLDVVDVKTTISFNEDLPKPLVNAGRAEK